MIDGAKILWSFYEHPELKENMQIDFFANIGLYVINPSLLKLIPKNRSYDMIEFIQSLIDSAFHEPTFEAGLSLDSDPLVYEFELSVSDTFPLGLTQFNGYDIDKDTVTITILPESNQFPVSFLDVTRTYDESGILLQSVDFICMA